MPLLRIDKRDSDSIDREKRMTEREREKREEVEEKKEIREKAREADRKRRTRSVSTQREKQTTITRYS